MDIPFIDHKFIETHTDFETLVERLRTAFKENTINVPMRHHHDFPNPEVGADSTLLLMPAWNPSKEAGVKIVTVSPKNGQLGLPSIQGSYIYLDALNGSVKALLEAKQLTAARTAATSALASSFLSKRDASTLLMIGTGALAPQLIKAHASVRPIKQVYVWGRNFDKAEAVCLQLKHENFELQPIKDIEEKISEVDIISSATLSPTPLVKGELLRPGQYVDLVGAYKKDMREADDKAIKKATVFVDTFEGGLKESGDIVIPIANGILKPEEIKADLFGLCDNKHRGRVNDQEVIVFKSVGHALEDLTAANYYYKQYIS